MGGDSGASRGTREGTQEGDAAPRHQPGARGPESGPREGPLGFGAREAEAGRAPLTCPRSPCWAAGSQRQGPPPPEAASSRQPVPGPDPQRPRHPPPPPLAGPWRAEPAAAAGKPQSGGERRPEGLAAPPTLRSAASRLRRLPPLAVTWWPRVTHKAPRAGVGRLGGGAGVRCAGRSGPRWAPPPAYAHLGARWGSRDWGQRPYGLEQPGRCEATWGHSLQTDDAECALLRKLPD